MPLISKYYLESVMFQKKTWNEIKKGFTHFQNNDVVVAKITPCFENSKAAIISNLPNNLGAGTTELHVIRPIKILPEYVYAIAKTKQFLESGKQEMTGCAGQQRVPTSFIEDYLIPIPPINEQQRITQTIKELLNLVETLENDKVNLSELIKKTKAKVLDLAIKGKLVPQNPNDEPTDKLLEKIREEKEKLIKEGKIKRDKNETFIFKSSDDNSYYEQIDGETVCIDDDLPFEIPDSWRWERLGNIGIARIGLTYKPKNVCREGIPVLRSNNINIDKLDLNDLIYVDCAVNNNLLIANNDIIICARNGSKNLVGKCALVTGLDYPMTYGAFMACYKSEINNYIFRFLNSTCFRTTMINANSTQINQLTQDMLKNTLCPIPPIKEQIKIVSIIKSIFTQLDRIQEIFLQ